MLNLTCKKITVDNFDYGSIVAHTHRKNLLGFKKEAKSHFKKIMMANANVEKLISSLSLLWYNFDGVIGAEKKSIIDACFFYGDKWTDYHQFERYNCLCVLTFDNYRDILHAVTDCGYEFFTADEVKVQLLKRVKTDLSEATLTDQINQIIGTMSEIGVVKRYKRGIYRLQKYPVFDAISIYIVLKTYEALSSIEEASWFLKCFNLEIDGEFVSFFSSFDYSWMAGKEVYSQFVSSSGTMRLSMGEWSCGVDEMFYDIGKTKSEVNRYQYVTINDVKEALRKDSFDDVWEEATLSR